MEDPEDHDVLDFTLTSTPIPLPWVNSTVVVPENESMANRTLWHYQGSCEMTIRSLPMPGIALGSCSLGFLLNLMMVIGMALVLKRSSVTQKATYYFLINLALSDTLWAALQIITSSLVLWVPREERKIVPHCLIQGLFATFRMSPGFFLLLKTIDCYVFIAHGMTYSMVMTSLRARILCLVTWVASIFFTFVPALYLYLSSANPEAPCESWDAFLNDPWFYIPTYILTLGPLLIIMALYFMIFYHIVGLIRREEAMKTKAGIRTEAASLKRPATLATSKLMKSFKATSLIIFTFVLTWMPQCVYALYNLKAIKKEGQDMGCGAYVMLALQLFLAYVNLLLDPIAYMWGYKDLRRVIKKTVRQRTKRRKHRKEVTLTTYVLK